MDDIKRQYPTRVSLSLVRLHPKEIIREYGEPLKLNPPFFFIFSFFRVYKLYFQFVVTY